MEGRAKGISATNLTPQLCTGLRQNPCPSATALGAWRCEDARHRRLGSAVGLLSAYEAGGDSLNKKTFLSTIAAADIKIEI